MRKKWIENYLIRAEISNASVAERETEYSAEQRKEEYLSFFDGEDCVVVTTNETDALFIKRGFDTVNHTGASFRRYLKEHGLPHRTELYSTGQLLRKRLRENRSCKAYLREEVETEASSFLQSMETYENH